MYKTSKNQRAILQNNISPAEVSQWTNHRVMEWLRSVDLAEYAPNLRGSGVHGGLMVRGSRAQRPGTWPSPGPSKGCGFDPPNATAYL